MKKQEPKTDFNFAYSDLEQLGDKALDLIDRDAAELLSYGVDATYRTEVETMIDALKNYPTDEELQGAASVATSEKDVAADELKVGIRGMMVRVKQVFGIDSPTYARFGTKGMDEMTDNDLVRCGRRVSRMATNYLTELAPKGVDAAMITALDVLTEALDDAIDRQDAAVRSRNSATQERVGIANTLYAKVVELFDFGKDHWFTRNEAKYNDYVIYNVPGGGSTPPATVTTGTVPAMTTVVVAQDVAPTATVTFRNVGTVAFTVCGSSTNTTDPCADGELLNAGEEMTFTGNSSGTNPVPPFLKISNTDAALVASYELSVSQST